MIEFNPRLDFVVYLGNGTIRIRHGVNQLVQA